MDLDLIILFYFQKLVRLLAFPFLRLIFCQKKGVLPPFEHKLLTIPAIELAKKIKKQEVTSEEVLRIFIKRIQTVNGLINAVSSQRFIDALEEARSADEKVAKNTPLDEFPFFGVPFSVKESFTVRGCSHAVGSVARKDFRAMFDAEVVKLMRQAGAIPICTTNVPEWCLSIESYNHLHGRTKNPYDLSRTSGGSSGGEGSLISAGGSLIGIGSDFAGCLRYPALFCGIFSHKPTATIVSGEGHFPHSKSQLFDSVMSYGPMTRYAADLPPMLYVLSNKNSDLRLDEPVFVDKVKIFYAYNFNNFLMHIPVDKSIKYCMKKAIQHFHAKALSIGRAKIEFADIFSIIRAMWRRCAVDFGDDLSVLGYKKDKPDNHFLEYLKSSFGMSQYTFSALGAISVLKISSQMSEHQMIKYLEKLDIMRQQFLDMLNDDGVFFFPTFCKPAVVHCDTWFLTPAIAFCQLFNFLGFPSTHVPMGLSDDGLPVGFQVIAAPYQDRLCLAVAKELEDAFGGWTDRSMSSSTYV